MKHFLFAFLISLISTKIHAQVVFCPPGAEWHSLFFASIFAPGNSYNEKIQYTGDSISGTDTLKILSHNRFYMDCSGFSVHKTYIKQKGDTVFFKNPNTPGWQILYNFAAQAGSAWQTVFSNPISTVTVTFTFQVLSVSTVTINGQALKQLSVSAPHWGAASTITERLGSNTFLFDFSIHSPSSCDGDWFQEPLCYKDNTFGTYLYSSNKSCDYFTQNLAGIVGYSGRTALRIYPNPTHDRINIKLESCSENPIILITNSIGKVVLKKKLVSNDDSVSVEFQEKGIYFIQLFDGEELLGTQKLVRN